MEEIYIIKLKGLPASSQESLRDNKASFYYRKDLTGEALLGFGVMHTFSGLLLVMLTTINLVRINWTSLVLGSGIWCGAIFAITGLMAIISAHKRKTDISKSKIQVKVFFSLTIITSLLATSYLILMIFDLKEVTFNQYIETFIVMAFISELFTSLLSLFTCMRIIWPGSLSFFAKDWPMHQKLKRKIIVSTQIYTNGVKQNEDMIRNLGPNCVISLSPPPTEAINNGGQHFGANYDTKTNNFVTICEFCDQNNQEFKSNNCEHNLRLHCMNEEDMVDDYDSEFDVDNFDSMVGQHRCDSTHSDRDNDHTYQTTNNDFTHETENKYETIDGNKTSDESNCLDNSENNDKSEDEEPDHQIKDEEPVLQSETNESKDSPKSCEKSNQSLSDV